MDSVGVKNAEYEYSMQTEFTPTNEVNITHTPTHTPTHT